MADELMTLLGTSCDYEWSVDESKTAHAMGNHGVYVLATPMVLQLIEHVASHCMAVALPEDWITLGTSANFRHLRPTPIGFTARVKVTVAEVDRLRVVFSVQVWDDLELVAEGTHERFAMPKARYLKMVADKSAQRGAE